MVYAGFSHLTFNRVDFQAQVPDWLPLSKDLVLLSGIVEIAGSWISFLEGTSNIWLGTCVILRFGVSRQYCAVPRPKDAFGALNSDNSRLIRLFSNRCLLLGPYGQLVRLKPGETTKLKLI
jgi:hypothetical protein